MDYGFLANEPMFRLSFPVTLTLTFWRQNCSISYQLSQRGRSV